MRTVFLALLILVLCVTAYGYSHNPGACRQLVDVVVAIFTTTEPVPALTAAPKVTVAPAIAPPAPEPKPLEPKPKPKPAPPPPVAVTNAPPAPHPATVADWQPPSPLPAQPNWTWTTTDGKTYQNVVILKVEPDEVSISHADGGSTVPLATLPPEIQSQLNYDAPIAATAAARRRAESEQFDRKITNYAEALVKASADRKYLLLNFTASDWNPDSQAFAQQVLADHAFRDFSLAHFVLVTFDFPRDIDQPPALKQQNTNLAQLYHIGGYPTFVMADLEGKELGRIVGYNSGTGPDPVVKQLQFYLSRAPALPPPPAPPVAAAVTNAAPATSSPGPAAAPAVPLVAPAPPVTNPAPEASPAPASATNSPATAAMP